jgi:hypothetical protein
MTPVLDYGGLPLTARVVVDAVMAHHGQPSAEQRTRRDIRTPAVVEAVV